MNFEKFEKFETLTPQTSGIANSAEMFKAIAVVNVYLNAYGLELGSTLDRLNEMYNCTDTDSIVDLYVSYGPLLWNGPLMKTKNTKEPYGTKPGKYTRFI
jgi:hypothetical protein